MNFSEYVDYFRTCAINHKVIAHNPPTVNSFYRMDIEEVLNGLRAKLASTSLILENPELFYDDLLSDNKRKIWRGAYLIVKQAKKNDFDDETQVLSDTLTIGEEVLSKLFNDSQKHRKNNTYTPAIGTFHPERVRIQKVGPLFDNYYGWRFEIEFNQAANRSLRLDATKWNSETEFTI